MFIKVTQSVVCLTFPQPLTKRVLHTVRSSTSSINFLPRRHPVAAYVFFLTLPPLLFFPSRMCFRRQCLRKSSYFLLYVWYSSPPCLYIVLPHFSHDRSNWPSPSFSSTTFKKLAFTQNVKRFITITIWLLTMTDCAVWKNTHYDVSNTYWILKWTLMKETGMCGLYSSGPYRLSTLESAQRRYFSSLHK